MNHTKNDSVVIEKNTQEELIVSAAKELGVDVSIMGHFMRTKSDGTKSLRPLLQLTKGDAVGFTLGATTSKTSYLAMRISANKSLTNHLLSSKNIPVPQQEKMTSQEDVLVFLEQEKTIVLKPLDARCGMGVITEISKPEDAKRHFADLQKNFKTIIGETHVSGSDHRILVIGDVIVAILKRTPPFVIGDGFTTIAQLIDNENNSPERLRAEKIKPIPIKSELLLFLKKQNLSLESVPEKEAKIILANVANISSGGTGEALKSIHPEVAAVAIQAAKELNLDVSGVDIVAPNLDEPLSSSGGKIIEVNGGPDMRIHYHVATGKSINPATALIESLLAL